MFLLPKKDTCNPQSFLSFTYLPSAHIHSAVPAAGPIFGGQVVTIIGLHFYVEDKVIHVSDAKVEKKHGDFFASNIVRLHELTKELSV